MKTITQKIRSNGKAVITLILLSTLVWSCSKQISDTSYSVDKLLPRNEILAQTAEADNVLKRFENLKNQLYRDINDVKASLELAELYMNEARITGEHPYYYPAALKAIHHGLNAKTVSDDDLFRGLSLKAAVEMSLHKFNEAQKTAEKAVSINPYNAGIYGILIDAHVELGNYTKAVSYADKMVSIRPDLRSYSRISYLREIHGDIEGAKEAMQLAIEAGFPGFESTAWAGYTLGHLLENYGDLKNAKQVYEGVLVERPNYAFAYGGLARIALKNKDFKTAQTLIEKAIRIMPEVSFYHSQADIYIATGQLDKAKATANKMIEMMKEDEASGHEMSMEMAYVYLQLLNDSDKALSYIEKEYLVRPTNIDVNRCMAAIYTVKQDWVKANFHMQQALAIGNRHPESMNLKKTMAQMNSTQFNTRPAGS